ncbi:hypothetical protein [Priestia flexa]|uniref:hypothetical protein n=1 Tax=Priestia flexa TaxID=86664 RepID=UPI001F4C7D0A|nr:hypothetical protein [Priestia flexa]
MENKQYWGVCVGEGKEAEIVAVYKTYDKAVQESMFFTHETQMPHTVMPVVKKKQS